MTKLPKVGERGEYKMPCRSIVYPSGSDYTREGVSVKMPDHGKFFLWVCDGEADDGTGVVRPFGHVACTENSLRYFKTPRDAINFLDEVGAGS